MEATLGAFPDTMRFAGTRDSKRFFDSQGALRYPGTASRESVSHVEKQLPLRRIVHKRDTVFLDLVKRMLTFDPVKRITAADALNHPLFTSVRKAKPLPVPLDVPAPRRSPSCSNSSARAHPRSAKDRRYRSASNESGPAAAGAAGGSARSAAVTEGSHSAHTHDLPPLHEKHASSIGVQQFTPTSKPGAPQVNAAAMARAAELAAEGAATIARDQQLSEANLLQTPKDEGAGGSTPVIIEEDGQGAVDALPSSVVDGNTPPPAAGAGGGGL